MFNRFNSLCAIVNNNLTFVFSYYYLINLIYVLLLFIRYRIPYCYRPYILCAFLITLVFRLFISLFLRRLLDKINVFFSHFIPAGTPIYICPLVCLAETISFIIRPIVLILRPLINISLGCFGVLAISKLCFRNFLLILLIFLLFFYECFVAIIHWYIVISILSFSIQH